MLVDLLTLFGPTPPQERLWLRAVALGDGDEFEALLAYFPSERPATLGDPRAPLEVVRDAVRAAGGLLIAASADGRRLGAWKHTGGTWASPARAVLLGAAGVWTEIEVGELPVADDAPMASVELRAGDHLIVPLTRADELRLFSFLDLAGDFPSERRDALVHGLRAPTLQARILALERSVERLAQQVAQPVPRPGERPIGPATDPPLSTAPVRGTEPRSEPARRRAGPGVASAVATALRASPQSTPRSPPSAIPAASGLEAAGALTVGVVIVAAAWWVLKEPVYLPAQTQLPPPLVPLGASGPSGGDGDGSDRRADASLGADAPCEPEETPLVVVAARTYLRATADPAKKAMSGFALVKKGDVLCARGLFAERDGSTWWEVRWSDELKAFVSDRDVEKKASPPDREP